eukprot:452445_1
MERLLVEKITLQYHVDMLQILHKKGEAFWSVWQENVEDCEAYNYFGATLYAVCVPNDLISQSQIKIEYQQISGGDVNVACPINYKVTGCGYKSNFAGGEPYNKIYANHDGNSCHCYNHFGGTCYSTCAPNIIGWQRYEISGNGRLTVSCKGESILLGCGIDLKQGNEGYPAYHPNGPLSCSGYSFYTYKLYVWCGSIA